MEKQKRYSLFALFFILALDELSFSIVIPIFGSLFFQPEFGFLPENISDTARNLLLSTLLAAFPLAQFFGAPFWGDFGDCYGRKKAFYVTISGTIFSHFFKAFAIFLENFPLLILGRIMTGFFAGNLALCMASIADISEGNKERANHLGLVATFLGLSRIGGILIGTRFINPEHKLLFNPSYPFLFIGGLSFVSLFILRRFFEETHPRKPSKKLNILKGFKHVAYMLKSKKLLLLYLIIFLWYLGYYSSFQWNSPYSLEWFQADESQVIKYYIGFAVVWALSSTLINRFLVRTYSTLAIYLAILPIIAVGFFLAALSSNWTLFATIYICTAGCVAIAWSNNLNLISLTASPEEQGKAMGVTQSMMSLDQFFAPLLGGLLSLISIRLIYFSSSFLVLIGFLILLYFVKKHKI